MASALERRLVALPTKAEIKSRHKTIKAFVADVPTRYANAVLKHSANTIDLHHLKRFVNPEHVRSPSETRVPPESLDVDLQDDIPQLFSILSNSAATDAGAEYSEPHDGIPKSKTATLQFLVCSQSSVSYEVLRNLLLSTPPFLDSELDPNLRLVMVPLFPPTSERQAKELSHQYWPTTYRGGNPFGPHPTVVARSAREIEGQVERYMRVAQEVGRATAASIVGENIGAVVVDRRRGDDATILVAAGDARWQDTATRSKQAVANAMAHSVMRVIGMVARKRLALSNDQHAGSQSIATLDYSNDEPVTSLEKEIYGGSVIEAGGYLCLDLELYLTHEPCVMCCMAINHSRFARVVFGRSMITGGLRPERKDSDINGVQCEGYGLWWRQELNWRFLTWQWIMDENQETTANAYHMHA